MWQLSLCPLSLTTASSHSSLPSRYKNSTECENRVESLKGNTVKLHKKGQIALTADFEKLECHIYACLSITSSRPRLINFNFTFLSCSLAITTMYDRSSILVRHVLCIVLAEKKTLSKTTKSCIHYYCR